MTLGRRTKMEKLKPCPFCGSEAKPVFRGSCNYVVCSNEEECWCGMTCPVSTPEEAARIWNRRVDQFGDADKKEGEQG